MVTTKTSGRTVPTMGCKNEIAVKNCLFCGEGFIPTKYNLHQAFCCKKHTRQARDIKNRDKLNAAGRKWRRDHPERTKELGKSSYQNNRVERLRREQEWRAKNKDAINEKMRQKRQENPEKFKKWARDYLAKNAEYVRCRAREYYAKNRERIRAQNRIRNARPSNRDQRARAYKKWRLSHLEYVRNANSKNAAKRADLVAVVRSFLPSDVKYSRDDLHRAATRLLDGAKKEGLYQHG